MFGLVKGLAFVGTKLPLLGRFFGKSAKVVTPLVDDAAKAVGAGAKAAAPLADDAANASAKTGFWGKHVTIGGTAAFSVASAIASYLIIPAIAYADNKIGFSKMSKRRSFFGMLAGRLLAIFGRGNITHTAEDLKRAEFKTSTQHMGISFTERVRDVFRFRWIKRQ